MGFAKNRLCCVGLKIPPVIKSTYIVWLLLIATMFCLFNIGFLWIEFKPHDIIIIL